MSEDLMRRGRVHASSGRPTPSNPVMPYLRQDRMPHIWCPGCGIGTTVNCFARALDRVRHRPATRWRSSRHRLHRPRRRLHEPRLVPHHPRPRDPLRHRPQARQPRAQGGRLLRRRRPLRHRRQPLHPRRAAQHGPDGHLRQQLHLRHDRRPGRPDHAARRRRRPPRRTATSRTRSTCPSSPTPAAPSTSPAGPSSTSASSPRRCARASSQEGLRLHRGHLAVPDALLRAATGSATASTS